MINIAKSDGLACMEGELNYQDVGVNLTDFFERAQECVPFVFTPTDKAQEHIPASDDSEKIDAPFKVFSIELLDRPLTSSSPEDLIRFGGVDVRIVCIMVAEIAPLEYDCYQLIEAVFPDGRPSKSVVQYAHFSNPNETHYSPKSLVRIYLDRLSRETIGSEKINEVVKIKNRDTKKKIEIAIKQICYVTPKKLQHGVKSPVSQRYSTIDWSHRWAVRGHWRIIDGVGKDRDGAYCIPNYTWVSSHVRGPENAPLITKTRIVK